jgi:hypothetical protein
MHVYLTLRSTICQRRQSQGRDPSSTPIGNMVARKGRWLVQMVWYVFRADLNPPLSVTSCLFILFIRTQRSPSPSENEDEGLKPPSLTEMVSI